MMVKYTIALMAALMATTVHSQEIGTRFINNHSASMYISMDWAALDTTSHPGLEWQNEIVQPGDTVFMPAPTSTRVKYYIGPVPNNRSAKVGSKRDHNTVVEAMYVGYSGFTYYDIDIEKGFSVPLWCHGEGDTYESGGGCLKDVLAACPAADRHYDDETGIYDYCIGTDTEESIAFRGALCPHVYVLSDDHETRVISSRQHVLKCVISNPLPTKIHMQKRSMRHGVEHAGYTKQTMEKID